MVPGCSPDPALHPAAPAALVERHGARLLCLARSAIDAGVTERRRPRIDLDRQPPDLRRPRASFVTLRVEGALRGCIGKARPCRPLAVDVAENAYAAAFEDGRFPPLAAADLDPLDIEVSVLGGFEPLTASDEADLLRQLRPGHDGLILEFGAARGLFLPGVWSVLPEPGDFVAQLKLKAGLERDFWSPRLTLQRFATATVSSETIAA